MDCSTTRKMVAKVSTASWTRLQGLSTQRSHTAVNSVFGHEPTFNSNEGNGKVVSVQYLVCPHYGEAKGQHLVSLTTRVCGELLNSDILAVP